MLRCPIYIYLMFVLTLPAPSSWSFSFSEAEQQEAQTEQRSVEAEQNEIADLLATPCSRQLKNRTCAFVLTQEHDQGFRLRNSSQDQAIYSVINAKLGKLGLRTLTPQQITARIAAAETEAFLSNDMDSAASAAQRLRATFFIKAQVITKQTRNPVLGIDEISINLLFKLSDESGKTLSDILISDTVFSDSNVTATLLQLVKQQGEKAVARLYRDFCRQEQ